VQVFPEQEQDLFARRRDVQAEHVGAGHHHLAHRGVLQLEHAVDHLALGPLHYPLARAHVHQGPQLILGDLGLVPATLGAHQPQGERGEAAEENAHGGDQARQPHHRPVHPGGEALGMLDGEGHGEHLAEHRQQEDHGDDGDGQARWTQQLLGDGGGEGGGADIDEGDAHQQGHQQLVRFPEEGGQGIGLGALLLGEPLEARAAQGEVGGLGAGEERRAEHEEDEEAELEDQEIIHGSARSRRARPPDFRRRRARRCRTSRPRSPRSR
jgi:hypothetical protein